MNDAATARLPWTVGPEPVGSAGSAVLLREYLTDVADRWYELNHARTSTPEEIDRHLAEDPSDDLTPPHGVLLVGRHGGEETARAWGVERIVLDTRMDLVEARALYARHGYLPIPRYNESPYAEVWLAKELAWRDRGHG
ncbi:GNAT family N-acetyltransferase [Streptomyces netropsis]